MQMGHGLPPALRMLAVGVRPTISSDVVTTVPADLFGAMRALLAGTRLMCRAHYWEYDVVTGQGINPESVCLRRFPVRVEDGRILVDVDG